MNGWYGQAMAIWFIGKRPYQPFRPRAIVSPDKVSYLRFALRTAKTLDARVPLDRVAQILGHESVDTRRTYTPLRTELAEGGEGGSGLMLTRSGGFSNSG